MQTEKIMFFTAISYGVTKKIVDGVNWALHCAVNNGAFIIGYKNGCIIEDAYFDDDIVKKCLTYLFL